MANFKNMGGCNMFGWVTEKKSVMHHVRKHSSEGVKKFCEKLKGEGYTVERDSSQDNCVIVKRENGCVYNCLMLSHNKSPQWQPYITTIEYMNKRFQNNWYQVGLNYTQENEAKVFYVTASDLNRMIESYNKGQTNDGFYKQQYRNYYEINYKCMRECER